MAAASLALGIGCLTSCGTGAAPAGTEARAPAEARPTGTAAAPTRAHPPARGTPSTVAPMPVDGHCPYLDARTVAGTVGQHIARTTVTRTKPYPGCFFYRPNGELAVEVAVSVLGDSTQAQAKAVAIGGGAANPVNGIADGGVVTVTAGGAVLAISKGRTLIVVTINQRSSLEAKEVARSVAGRIG
jgi:UPF0176 protein